MKYGLKESTINGINEIFAQHTAVEQAILYGSRAKGNFRNGSDIDLTLIGHQVSLTELMKIENEIDDLLLPYSIDLSQFHKINNPDLIAHIERVVKTFFSR
jgi:uncharacterized protein